MTVGRSGDQHVRDWANLHLTAPPGGFVGAWLRGTAAVSRPLARAGVSPHVVSVAALAFALASVGLAAIDGWVGPAAACAAVTASGLLDALDGAVAVQAGKTTAVGFLLDSALDRIADAAFAAALAVVAGTETGVALAVGATAASWYLEYVRARASLALRTPAEEATRQVVTPGERPTRIILTAVGLGIPTLAGAALWAHVVIVGGSALFLLAHSLRRLSRQDAAPPAPRTGSPG